MSFDVFNSMTLCDNTQFDNFFTVPQKYKKKNIIENEGANND